MSKLASSSNGQRGSAARLCGKPVAFRTTPPISLSPRRLEGAAFQTARRRLVSVHALRKGEAFPHSGAAEPLISTHPIKRNPANPSIKQVPLREALLRCHGQNQHRGMLAVVINGVRRLHHARGVALVFSGIQVPVEAREVAAGYFQTQLMPGQKHIRC